MYRIELSPGEETAFRTIEELAVAIRRNVVTARARIYHHATGRWLPIQFHPHYKQALSMPLTQADLVAGPRVAPLSTLQLGEPTAPANPPGLSSAASQAAMAAWPEPKAAAAQPAPQPPQKPLQAAAAAPAPIRLGTPAPEPRVSESRRAPAPRMAEPVRFIELPRTPAPKKTRSPRRRGKPQRSFRVALAGAVLIACAQLVISSTTQPPQALGRPRTARHLIELPARAEESVRTVAAVMPGLQSIPVPGLTAPRISAATRGPARQPEFTPPAPAMTDSARAADSLAILSAPDASEISTSVPTTPVTPPVVDSSRRKAMKGILRTIGGNTAAEAKPAKR